MKQKKDYSKVSKRSNNTSKKYDFLEDYISIAIELYYKGFTRETVYEYFTQELKIAPSTANGVLDSALRKTKDSFDIDKNYILNLHIKRYEDISSYCESIKVNNPKDIFEINKKFDSLITWLESLNQKEKLLGFHTKTFKVKFKNYLSSKNKKVAQYDFSKLSFEELLTLKEYLTQNTEQKFMIKARKIDEEIKIEDTEEIVIEESPLRKETEIKKKVKLVKSVIKQINENEVKPSPNLEDIKRKILEKSIGK